MYNKAGKTTLAGMALATATILACGCLEPTPEELRREAAAYCDIVGGELVSYVARYDENGCFTGFAEVVCRDGGIDIPEFEEPWGNYN